MGLVADFTKEEAPGSDWRTWVPSVFTKGGARENRLPGGVEKSMLIFENRLGSPWTPCGASNCTLFCAGSLWPDPFLTWAAKLVH